MEECACKCVSAQLCPTLCDPMDCSPPGSSVYGILGARILEWVAISYSRGSSWPRDPNCVSSISCNWQAGSLPLVPMQETRIQSLVWEDLTCYSANKPEHHNFWTHTPEPALCSRRSLRSDEKPVHHSETVATARCKERKACAVRKTQHKRK